MDEIELGTADFRCVKFKVYEAGLAAPDGSGLSLRVRADAHFRAALAPQGVAAYMLWRCLLGQVALRPGDRIQGESTVRLGTHP
jgi:hypothetical protein